MLPRRRDSYALHPLDQPGDRTLDEAGLGGAVGRIGEFQLRKALCLGPRQIDGHIAGKAARKCDRDMGGPADAEDQVAQHRQDRWFR